MAPTQLQLRERLADLVSEHGVPGASVSVLVDGEITDAEAGVVNVRTGVEVGRDSPFMIQSTTKVWTATLVMQLVDEGLVELDAAGCPLPVRVPDRGPAGELGDHRQAVAHAHGWFRGRHLGADEQW